MSEFVNKAKIAELQQANADLQQEIESLQGQLKTYVEEKESLNQEVSKENETSATELSAEAESSENDFSSNIVAINSQMEQSPGNDKLVEEFLSLLKQSDCTVTASEIDRYYKKNQRLKIIISFLLGILLVLALLFMLSSTSGNQSQNSILKPLIQKFNSQ